MDSIRDWTTVHEHLKHLLPHDLDAATWEVLRQQPLPFVADELLWRVEAFVQQVPAQSPISFRSIARTDDVTRSPVVAFDPVSASCELCNDQPGSGFGKRCALCVAAIRLVLGFPLLLDDA